MALDLAQRADADVAVRTDAERDVVVVRLEREDAADVVGDVEVVLEEIADLSGSAAALGVTNARHRRTI